MKAYLYCTKAKPYLQPNGAIGTVSTKYNLNGFVFFECEINKVEEIRHDYSPSFRFFRRKEGGISITRGDDLFFTKSVSIPVDFERQTCLNTEQLNSYLPRYALYLENVKKIDKPFTVSTAPQNMCYMTMNGERCVIISIQPQHLANIANGLKDIEVRKSILNELKGLIK